VIHWPFRRHHRAPPPEPPPTPRERDAYQTIAEGLHAAGEGLAAAKEGLATARSARRDLAEAGPIGDAMTGGRRRETGR